MFFHHFPPTTAWNLMLWRATVEHTDEGRVADLRVAEQEERRILGLWTNQWRRAAFPALDHLSRGYFGWKRNKWLSCLSHGYLGSPSWMSNLNPTQDGVEGHSEKCNSTPVSLTECSSFQHPMQRQRQQVQVHFLRYASYGGERFPQGVLKRMMTFFSCHYWSCLSRPLLRS